MGERAKTTREHLDEFDTPEWRAANTWVWRNAPHGGTRYQDAKLRYQTAVARIATLEAERDEAVALLWELASDGVAEEDPVTREAQTFLARYDEPSDGGAGS